MRIKQKRAKIVISILVLAGVLVLSPAVYAGSLEPSAAPNSTMKTLDEVEPRIPIHANDLPLTISLPKSYYLTETINFSDTSNNAITIEANDVSIDLMGYSLIGPGSGTGNGIFMSSQFNVEIRNGTVRGFGGSGIYEDNSNAVRNHRVIGVRAMSNGSYGIRLKGNGQLVKDCTAWGNNDIGIFVNPASRVTGCVVYNNQGMYGIRGSGSGHIFTDNWAYDNNDVGIGAGAGSTVTGNTAYANNGDGIIAGDGSTVIGNTARANGGKGIYATGDGSTVTGNTTLDNQNHGIYVNTGCTVTNNTVNDNNIFDDPNDGGIHVLASCLVKGNTVVGNKENNIYVEALGNAIEENLVTDSTGNGIYFKIPGNFYANNRAKNNSSGNYAGNVPVGVGDGLGNVGF